MNYGRILLTNNKIEFSQRKIMVLKLRPFVKSDIEILYQSYLEYIQYLKSIGINKSPPSFKAHQEFILKFLDNYKNHPYKKIYILEDDGNFIGNICIKKSNEFGYKILNKFQGQGFGDKMFELFFKKHPKNELWASILPNNIVSQRFLEKHGFELTEYEYHPKNYSK